MLLNIFRKFNCFDYSSAYEIKNLTLKQIHKTEKYKHLKQFILAKINNAAQNSDFSVFITESPFCEYATTSIYKRDIIINKIVEELNNHGFKAINKWKYETKDNGKKQLVGCGLYISWEYPKRMIF